MQYQLQMPVIQHTYCDFVVWQRAASLHVECLNLDETLIAEVLPKEKQFFKLCIFLELTGKWFTCQQDINDIEVPAEDHEDEGTWYYCEESKGGDMVGWL